MNHAHTHRASGFTLAELVVAVGLVAVLLIGIGQLFNTVTRLSGTGTAAAEVDAFARTIEQQLRSDFEGFNRMLEDETFIVIRNRRLGGDLNRDGTISVNAGERILYTTLEDRERDERRGIIGGAAYTNPNGLGRTVRLDDMSFIALGGSIGGFQSFQQDERGRTPITAQHALIRWGHGLRPAVVDYDPNDPDSFRERRFFVRDNEGRASFALGEGFGALNSRNEFVGQGLLSRQQMLLYGGLAAGFPTTSNRESPIGNERSYVPYVREYEAASYPDGFDQRFFSINPANFSDGGGINIPDLPNPRLSFMGRTDIIAQNLFDTIRWLAGEEDRPLDSATGYLRNDPEAFPNDRNSDLVAVPLDATAFDSGFLDLSRRLHTYVDTDSPADVRDADFSLFKLRNGSRAVGVTNIFDFDRPLTVEEAFRVNLRNYQSALAGTLSRVLIEPDPYPSRANDSRGPVNAAVERMDLHALINERCSSFEIAWSDGATWVFDETVRIDTDGFYIEGDPDTVERTIGRGDIIWFDMDFTRRDLWDVIAGDTAGASFDADGQRTTNINRAAIVPNADFDTQDDEFSPRSREAARELYPVVGGPDPEIGDRAGAPSTLPIQYRDGDDNLIEIPNSDGRFNRLFGFGDVEFNDPGSNFAEYSGALTGGVVPDTADPAAAPDEYFGVWGFRVPNGNAQDLGQGATAGLAELEGGYGISWEKPRYIRVRMTLHDRQFRIPGGREYEFVIELNPISAE